MKYNFRKKLEALLNREPMENGSDTPDFILAEFLSHCLTAFDHATRARIEWYSRAKRDDEEGK